MLDTISEAACTQIFVFFWSNLRHSDTMPCLLGTWKASGRLAQWGNVMAWCHGIYQGSWNGPELVLPWRLLQHERAPQVEYKRRKEGTSWLLGKYWVSKMIFVLNFVPFPLASASSKGEDRSNKEIGSHPSWWRSSEYGIQECASISPPNVPRHLPRNLKWNPNILFCALITSLTFFSMQKNNK